jgi:hypothetical protein
MRDEAQKAFYFIYKKGKDTSGKIGKQRETFNLGHPVQSCQSPSLCRSSPSYRPSIGREILSSPSSTAFILSSQEWVIGKPIESCSAWIVSHSLVGHAGVSDAKGKRIYGGEGVARKT